MSNNHSKAHELDEVNDTIRDKNKKSNNKRLLRLTEPNITLNNSFSILPLDETCDLESISSEDCVSSEKENT